MDAKMITLVLAATLAIAHCSVIPGPAPLAYAAQPVVPVAAKLEEYDPHPQYGYEYKVEDSLTGDQKGAYEIREGDVVRGSYSVVEPDGTLRVVDYTADPLNGFVATVRREPAVVRAAVPVAPAVAPLRVHPLVH